MASTLPLSLSSLNTSLTHLNTALATLETCTADLPRLSHILTTTRHFELLPSSTLSSAQSGLIDEIKPEIEGLLKKVEAVVERRERREEWLRARWELYEGRLGRDGEAQNTKQSKEKRKSVGDGLKAQRLRQKKERLSYAVERLTLQAQQRERQLRMSMAAQGVEGITVEDQEDEEV